MRDHKVKDGFARLGVAPPVALGPGHDQAVRLCFALEDLVVVHTPIAAILDVQNLIVVAVRHFMDK